MLGGRGEVGLEVAVTEREPRGLFDLVTVVF